MRLTVIGTGFVGVVTAAVFASFGNEVIGLDIDQKKIDALNGGTAPFFEPNLNELLQAGLSQGKIHFTTDYAQAIPGSQVVFVAVGTPSAPDGTADLTYVKKAVAALAPYIDDKTIIAIKSTVPPGTLDQLRPILDAGTSKAYVLASLPEFLREGSAVADTLHPDRVVIGCADAQATQTLQELHAPLQAPVFVVRPESAQMGKYSANAYLATRITFINQIADLCEQNGADVEEVIRIIGADNRIGSHYWYPGLGYGGSCFPKDVRELAAYSRTIGYGQNLFNKVHELNADRVYVKLDQFGEKLGGWSGKTVAVLGLAFKPNTDDMREAPSTKVIPHLLHEGARVVAYDPLALEAAKQVLGQAEGLSYTDTLESALQEADGVIQLVEWPEFRAFPFSQWGRTPAGVARFFIDARNQQDAAELLAAGWQYFGVGRNPHAE